MEWRQSLHPEYEVSEEGQMRALVARYRRPIGTIIKGSIENHGYRQYSLVDAREQGRGAKKRHYRAHTLVLHAFIGPCPVGKDQGAHYDGDRLNNHFSNLRWATAAENTEDKVRHGNVYKGRRKLTAEQVLAIRRRRKEGATYDSIMLEFPISRGNLSSLINRQTWAYLPEEK